MVNIDHPIFLRERLDFLSRSILAWIFPFQNVILDVGRIDFLQFLWPCQKQPLTKIIVLYFFKIMSGFPGKVFWCSLYLNPFENRNWRTNNSGFVFFARILLITSLRFFFVKTSAIVCENNKMPAENCCSVDVWMLSQIEFRQPGWVGCALAFLALGKVGFCVGVLCALPRAKNSVGQHGKVLGV